MKNSLFIVLILICFGCNTKKNISNNIVTPKIGVSLGEVELQNKKINFWKFNGNSNNEISGGVSWDLRNVDFNKNSMVLDGIYEYSGRFVSEKVNSSYFNSSINKHSIVLKFKIDKSHFKATSSTIPIIVGGKSYRWIKVLVDRKGYIKISFTGNYPFSIPNEDISMKPIKINKDDFNTLYLSWNTDKNLIYVSLNDIPSLLIELPINFEWNKADRMWTFQDYSSGTAYKGEIDYLLTIDEFLDKNQLKKLLMK